ncbi:hypothetical protein LS684_04435 [Cytobacillus spongiae]|uniref:hypothetical protein n=1 Tax=Cytobacillus spongiae TaxID=2901381 RepID=UPI001F379B90|nr:hypothetical protein [Cytobacillus spongiae]UII56719.1 hypothetical protein LS684_04435 [Cytobacillus spongiae]
MRVITLDEKDIVIGIKYVGGNCTLLENEFSSDIGEFGQKMQSDGTFIDIEPVQEEPIETLEQKIERLEQQIQQDNLIQFEVLATIYEELLLKGSV